MDGSDDDSFDRDDESYDSYESEKGDEEEQHDQLPNVDEYKAQVGHREQQPSFWGTFCSLSLFMVAITVITVLIVQSQSTVDGQAKAYPFIQGNTERYLAIKEYITTKRGISHEDHLSFESSPAYIAAQWMAHGDKAAYPVPSTNDLEFDERYALTVLYFATGGDRDWHYDLNWLSEKHVCQWFRSFQTMDTQQTLVYGVSGCLTDEDGKLYPHSIRLSTCSFVCVQNSFTE